MPVNVNMKVLPDLLFAFVALSITPICFSQSGDPLEACGINLPEVPGFNLSVKAENGICYGDLISNLDLNPGVLTEENSFRVEPVGFHKSVTESGRFNEQGTYTYSYAVEDMLLQDSEVGRVDFAKLSAFGSASIRVLISPFSLWGSDENIAAANDRYSINKTGLWMDCFYGLTSVRGRTVKLSACLPRSSVKTDPKVSDLKAAFEWIDANNGES